MIRYYKLFDLLIEKNMKLTDLRTILSSATIAKLRKGAYISGEAIDKLCSYLDCQPGDIMSYVTSNKIKVVHYDEQGNVIREFYDVM